MVFSKQHDDSLCGYLKKRCSPEEVWASPPFKDIAEDHTTKLQAEMIERQAHAEPPALAPAAGSASIPAASSSARDDNAADDDNVVNSEMTDIPPRFAC